jgi:CheY-like chemotaxis protein
MKNILVIDDENITRSLIQICLTDAGYSVKVAESGKQGLDFFRDEKFDLVITDILMPDKTGVELIPELLEIANIPVIAISGGRRKTFNSDHILESALASGAAVTLKKPISNAVLCQTVKKLLAE